MGSEKNFFVGLSVVRVVGYPGLGRCPTVGCGIKAAHQITGESIGKLRVELFFFGVASHYLMIANVWENWSVLNEFTAGINRTQRRLVVFAISNLTSFNLTSFNLTSFNLTGFNRVAGAAL